MEFNLYKKGKELVYTAPTPNMQSKIERVFGYRKKANIHKKLGKECIATADELCAGIFEALEPMGVDRIQLVDEKTHIRREENKDKKQFDLDTFVDLLVDKGVDEELLTACIAEATTVKPPCKKYTYKFVA